MPFSAHAQFELQARLWPGLFTLLMASHAIARLHTSAAGIIQRYHLYHRHERDEAYDGP